MNRSTRKISAFAAILFACCLLVPQAFGKAGQLEVQSYDVQSQAVAVSIINTADAPMSGYLIVEALLGNERVRSTVQVGVMGGERAVVTVGFGSPVSSVVVGMTDQSTPF